MLPQFDDDPCWMMVDEQKFNDWRDRNARASHQSGGSRPPPVPFMAKLLRAGDGHIARHDFSHSPVKRPDKINSYEGTEGAQSRIRRAYPPSDRGDDVPYRCTNSVRA